MPPDLDQPVAHNLSPNVGREVTASDLSIVSSLHRNMQTVLMCCCSLHRELLGTTAKDDDSVNSKGAFSSIVSEMIRGLTHAIHAATSVLDFS